MSRIFRLHQTCLLLLLSFLGAAQSTTSLNVTGLREPVEIITDQWGIPHIYAENEADLFFAQGYYAAKDRLFQFEVWRRQATGTVAELLGKRELKRDIGTRLFRFRGDMEAEMAHYHPRGKLIIESFVAGVNAFIEYVNANPDELPVEFELLNTRPEKWTPAVVISRHQGLLGNIEQELNTARAVALLGAEKVQQLAWFHPRNPKLELDAKIDPDRLFDPILELYEAYRKPVDFRREDLSLGAVESHDAPYYAERSDFPLDDELHLGSNNWVVSGEHTQSGFPMMANDPHRRQAVPSLRYMAHLVAPGWNVIGGGEPEIPGISIGHNEHGAWGLTVYRTDAEDLYVYRLNPDNQNQYWYQGRWESMTREQDTIPVAGANSEIVTHRYTRHGPVVYFDPDHNLAYAIRCGWLEVGGSPYLASLRMNQSKNFEEFREACNFSHIPGENMIWADRNGHIGWQAVGIAPVRRNWSGLVPVPGDGSYEWEGYLPIIAKPNVKDPARGIIHTANENVTPESYEFWDAVGFSWADPYRGDRVQELLGSGRKHSLMDFAQYQTDYLSIPARELVPLLGGCSSSDTRVELARKMLLKWDCRLNPESIPAGIYNQWERELRKLISQQRLASSASPYLNIQLKRVIEFLQLPDGEFGQDAIAGRNEVLLQALELALTELEKQMGADMKQWSYGQVDYKHILLRHPLSNAVSEEWRNRLNVGPAPRGGNAYTVNSTGNGNNQPSGGSFRILVDTGNWDHCLGTNTPGQNGNPDHPHYRNLFELWAKDQYFPLFYSREKVESVAAERWRLGPEK
jgi:penicillin amidase